MNTADIAQKAIRETKRQFLFMMTGEYLITGFFYFFLTVGSLLLEQRENHASGNNKAGLLLFSLFIFRISNGLWEIITGYYADKFRRTYSISYGFFSCAFGWIIMILALFMDPHQGNLFKLIWSIGVCVWSLGPALLSGAEEAWLADRCNFYSKNSSEHLGDTFRKSSVYGLFAYSVGAGTCLAIFYILDGFKSISNHSTIILWSAVIASMISLLLFIYTKRIKEEYWSHPKFKSEESIFAFVYSAFKELITPPLLWFCILYTGVMGFGFLLVGTIWPYIMGLAQAINHDPREYIIYYFPFFILVQFIAGIISIKSVRLIKNVEDQWKKIILAALIYIGPIIIFFHIVRFMPELSWTTFGFDWNLPILTLCFVIIAYRISLAPLVSSASAYAQHIIRSDEKRALLVSIASAIASFVTGVIFAIAYIIYNNLTSYRQVAAKIEMIWLIGGVFYLLALLFGGFWATRKSLYGK